MLLNMTDYEYRLAFKTYIGGDFDKFQLIKSPAEAEELIRFVKAGRASYPPGSVRLERRPVTPWEPVDD